MARRIPAERGGAVASGAALGLLAGAIFAVIETLVAAAQGNALMPWRMFASTLLGASALESPAVAWVFFVGLVMHFAISAFYGLVWGAVASALPARIRDSLGIHTLAGAGFGFVVWLVNFQLIARAIYPWFLGTDAGAQILMHVIAFGAPLGFFLAMRLQVLDRELRVDERQTLRP